MNEPGKIRGSGPCEFCEAKTDEWCRDDCPGIDPLDWR